MYCNFILLNIPVLPIIVRLEEIQIFNDFSLSHRCQFINQSHSYSTMLKNFVKKICLTSTVIFKELTFF